LCGQYAFLEALEFLLAADGCLAIDGIDLEVDTRGWVFAVRIEASGVSSDYGAAFSFYRSGLIFAQLTTSEERKHLFLKMGIDFEKGSRVILE